MAEKIDSIFEEGRELCDKQKYKEALEKFKEIIKIDPKYYSALHNCGYVTIQLGDFKEAEKYFLDVLKINDKYLYSYHGLGMCYEKANDDKKALEYFDKAIDIAKENKEKIDSELYLLRGNLHYKMGSYENAIEDFTNGISHTQNKDKLALLYMNRGTASAGNKDYNGAISDYKKCLSTKKNDVIKEEIGRFYYILGQFENAMTYYEELQAPYLPFTLKEIEKYFPKIKVYKYLGELFDDSLRHYMIMLNNGVIYGTGNNTSGECGFGNFKNSLDRFRKVKLDFKCKSIAMGLYHTVFLTEQGQVYSCGNNFKGQLGYETENEKQNIPKHIPLDQKVVEIMCDWETSFFRLDGGGVCAAGGIFANKYVKKYFHSIPIPIWKNEKIIQMLDLEYDSIAFLLNDNTIYAYGNNQYKQINDEGEPKKFNEFTKISKPSTKMIKILDKYHGIKYNVFSIPKKTIYDLSDNFICPITQDIMKDPVILVETAQTYEREALIMWLKDHDTDPLTNITLSSKLFISNLKLKNVIQDWLKIDGKK